MKEGFSVSNPHPGFEVSSIVYPCCRNKSHFHQVRVIFVYMCVWGEGGAHAMSLKRTDSVIPAFNACNGSEIIDAEDIEAADANLLV